MELEGKELAPSAREWIARRRWSDDPAEMRRIIYCAALTALGAKIEAAHFPPRRRKDHEAYVKRQFDAVALEDIVRHKIDHFFGKLGSFEAADVYPTVIAQVERPLLELCLKWAGGNRLKAARVLGINRNTLRRKLRELGIEHKGRRRGK